MLGSSASSLHRKATETLIAQPCFQLSGAGPQMPETLGRIDPKPEAPNIPKPCPTPHKQRPRLRDFESTLQQQDRHTDQTRASLGHGKNRFKSTVTRVC